MTRNDIPGSIIGYTSRGPIRLQAGGSIDAPELPVPAPPAPAPAPSGGPLYTAEDIAKARQEEKDKLYERLNKQGTKLNAMEEQLKAWQTERETAQQAEQARLDAEADAARKAKEEEMTLRQLLDERDREYRAELTRLEQERAAERALLEKDRQFAQLQAHTQRRISEERENIAPELIDLITGNNPEEVEQSIALMKAKTDALLTKFGEATASMAAGMRGVSTAGYTSDGPSNTYTAPETYTPEELAAMPMSVFREKRGALLGAASQTNQGIFG